MKHFYNRAENYLALLMLIIITASCVSTKTITIEIPQKSKNDLPPSIQSLTIVSRTVDSRYNNLKKDSLQRIFYKHNFNYDTIVNDIQAVDTTLKALGDLLFETGRYDIVIPENRFLPFKKNSFLSVEMPWNEVTALCDTFNTDAVLSLDHFKTKVSTEFRKESFYDPEVEGFVKISIAEMNVAYEALFRVYDPVQKKIILREFIRDTIFWDDSDMYTRTLFKRFTPVKSALSEAGIAIALDMSEKIGTIWRPEHRVIFINGSKKLKDAVTFVDGNNWDPAMAMWKDIAENSKSKSTRSKAEFNIAVGYEIEGNIDEAVTWALKSYKTMYRKITYAYLERLKQRKAEIKKHQQ